MLFKIFLKGIPGWLSQFKGPPSAHVMISWSWVQAPCWAPCSAWKAACPSLLAPLPLLPLCLRARAGALSFADE